MFKLEKNQRQDKIVKREAFRPRTKFEALKSQRYPRNVEDCQNKLSLHIKWEKRSFKKEVKFIGRPISRKKLRE